MSQYTGYGPSVLVVTGAIAAIVMSMVVDGMLEQRGEIEAACKGGCTVVGPEVSIPVGFVMVAIGGLVLLASWVIGPHWRWDDVDGDRDG
jgi:hypothetical protein